MTAPERNIPAELLTATAAAFEHGVLQWGQGNGSEDASAIPAGCYCAIQGLKMTLTSGLIPDANYGDLYHAKRRLAALIDKDSRWLADTIIKWNDTLGRTMEEVAGTMLAAAAS